MMVKKVLSLALAGLLVSVIGVQPAWGNSKEERQARFVEKVKQGVSRLGVGEAARVEVKLRDETKIRGYVGEADEDSFTVVNPASGVTTRVPYPQVKQVKGNNLTTGAVIGIVAGAVFLVALIANIFGG